MKKQPPQVPEAANEPDVRSHFTERELEQAGVLCAGCRWGHPLIRVYGVSYFHKATDGLGGMRPCEARHYFQDQVRQRPV